MCRKMKWLDRDFSFSFPVTVYPELIERLRNTPSRLEKLVNSAPQNLLVQRDGQSWSIQENAGHLLTVESLFEGRLDDYQSGAESLRPADFKAKRTDKANYNSFEIKDILTGFHRTRDAYVARLEQLETEYFGRSAIHPRLNKPVRLCDMIYFQAEHDLHHLLRIEELIDKFMAAA